ncbi:putative ATPase (AAA+ superfamily) [Desulfitobacterium dichloroeliminans LMG P-21439]|uniref:Putative ATPase (AAA+ superfamily) n=1 Tax=Desulfitobacterium dichloroeliminans (strain LMG P-21439 / DCA1) TaxID=871963 RepID=L0FCF9_DESDL|nr:ATP-binding protein [Desulfitobacterium dichloroeliminans]AGA70628.1 putative ATPase (AAA+ superfamily) [Desulfitobacterium dichloroeliminans LMG P-21439]
MKEFIDRHDELDFLDGEYTRDGSSLVVLYGRRRVGKTALLTKFMENKPSIYFLATQESETENRHAFKDTVADFLQNSLLKTAVINDWATLFNTLMEYLSKTKLLIIIDEFQYLGKTNSAFPSVFQKIWDTSLMNKNIMIVLCGSLISMMESQTLAYSSPLYGRRTGQKKLKQIDFRYYNEFFKDKSKKELIERYAVTGGVPKYIEQFQGDSDIYTAIRKNVLNKASFLYEEPHFLLQNEVSEIGSYFSVIKAVAAGNQKLSKIAATLEVKQTGLSKYLRTLIDLDILERQVPITEDHPEKSKRGLYKIKDNFISFWFRFVYPNLSFLERDQVDIVMRKIRENFIDNHVAYVYEEVCLSELWHLNSKGQWPFYFNRAGRWWDNQTEIDLVAYDSKGTNMIFGECKYHEKPVDTDIFYALVKKSEAVTWKQSERKNWYVLFSINGFSEAMQILAKERADIVLSS